MNEIKSVSLISGSSVSYGITAENRPMDKMKTVQLANEGRSTASPTTTEVGTHQWTDQINTKATDPRIFDISAEYSKYRRICGELSAILRHADGFLVEGKMSDEGAGIVVEVEELLDQLYGCKWGEGECLKRTVVAINSQINNIRWERDHIEFLKSIANYLKNTYTVDEFAIDECYKLIADLGLDAFRGTVASSVFQKQYRIEEISGS